MEHLINRGIKAGKDSVRKSKGDWAEGLKSPYTRLIRIGDGNEDDGHYDNKKNQRHNKSDRGDCNKKEEINLYKKYNRNFKGKGRYASLPFPFPSHHSSSQCPSTWIVSGYYQDDETKTIQHFEVMQRINRKFSVLSLINIEIVKG